MQMCVNNTKTITKARKTAKSSKQMLVRICLSVCVETQFRRQNHRQRTRQKETKVSRRETNKLTDHRRCACVYVHFEYTHNLSCGDKNLANKSVVIEWQSNSNKINIRMKAICLVEKVQRDILIQDKRVTNRKKLFHLKL